MATTIQNNFRVRRNFGKINKITEIPNLIAIQKCSYDKFLQADVPPEKRDDTGLQGVFKSVFPIKDFNETSLARVRQLPPREAQVRRRRVPPAGHDVLRPDQGGRPPGRLGQGRGDRRAVDPRREGAGGLLRRDPAHDGERDLHHQRDRAGRRLPAPPLPGRLLRPRQGQEPLVGQAPLQRPHHPVPRLVDRLRVRPQGHPLRAHRPPPEAPGHGAAARARRDARHGQEGPGRVPRHRRGDPQVLLRHRDDPDRGEGEVREGPRTPTCSRASARRATSAIRRRTRSSSRRTGSTPRARSRSSRRRS